MRKELAFAADEEIKRESYRSEWHKANLIKAKAQVSDLIKARRDRGENINHVERRSAAFERMLQSETILQAAEKL